jgi:hypothetical protein
MELHIARDYSTITMTRYRKDGKESGEEFREDHVVPLLEKAISQGQKLLFVVDICCSAAFLHEVFAKLPQHGLTRQQISNHLVITAIEPHLEHYAVLVMRRYLPEPGECTLQPSV